MKRKHNVNDNKRQEGALNAEMVACGLDSFSHTGVLCTLQNKIKSHIKQDETLRGEEVKKKVIYCLLLVFFAAFNSLNNLIPNVSLSTAVYVPPADMRWIEKKL